MITNKEIPHLIKMVENENFFEFEVNRPINPIESYEEIPIRDPLLQVLQETSLLNPS